MFKDLKIVELASVLAGPLTGSFFSELGAEVIKIENKRTNGDITRTWKLPSEDKNATASAYYSAANYSKKVLLLDLTNASDYQTLILHLKEADIVISNFKPDSAKKLRLDYDHLKEYNETIIYAELTGFGSMDSRPAFDVVLQAETGFMYMNGEPNGNPVKMPVALIDILASHHMKEAILCAIINKLKTGKGKHIEISLYNSALASLANQATNWLMAGHIPEAMGSQHPNIAPYGDLYLTKDNTFIVLAVGTDKQFIKLCSLLQLPIAGFETNEQRLMQRKILNSMIGDCFKTETAKYWSAKLERSNIPYGVVKNMKEVFQDEKSKNMLVSENIEGLEAIKVKTALI
ncbi:CoA transferase [Maribacter arenosus]|uniref:CoA transferase n=2 Tax=Maribacter arenosus TaxID=1854708 RepID=A0ABR7VDT8_9FLAO|nr:CoA transferase [Maribacter arenosus]